MELEDLKPQNEVRGFLPDRTVTVVNVQWFGTGALELTYKDPAGRVASVLLYRDDEPRLELVEEGRPWSFDSDGALFRLVSEAHRIRLAYLFDPLLAVHTSLLEPLPHQITAVYESILPRQRLRILLADDAGAGKTIMAGLLIKKLLVRGDVQRSPGGESGESRRSSGRTSCTGASSSRSRHHQRQAGGRADRQLVPGERPGDCAAGQVRPGRVGAGEAGGSGVPVGPHSEA